MLQVGTLMSILSISMIGAKVLLGMTSDKIGLQLPLLGVIILSVSAFLLMPFKSYAILALSMVFMSFTFGFQTVLPPLFTGKIFGQKDYAKIWGVVGMSGSLGTAVGPPIWGMVYDITKSYYTGLIIAPGLIIIGGLSYAYALKTGEKLEVNSSD
jgi:predicted MFS family arabinose efflux permease